MVTKCIPSGYISMTEGTKYSHRYDPNYSCVVLNLTAIGARVSQTQKFPGTRKKDKVTVQFYFAVDFHPQKGLWIQQ